jgi:hypothetical protein
MTYIYALTCPSSAEIRYIGKAVSPERRLRSHIRDARSGVVDHAAARWIRSLLQVGRAPVLRVLFEVPEGVRWQDAERGAIAEHQAAGANLTNSTRGGGGLALLRAEDRIAVSAALSRAWARPGARSMRITAILAGNARPEARQRRVDAAAKPETKKKHSAGIRAGLFEQPEVMERRRQSQIAAANRPEVKVAKATASKTRWADPQFRAAMRQKQLAGWVKRKEGMQT